MSRFSNLDIRRIIAPSRLRATQRTIIPTAVKSRSLSGVVYKTELSSASTTLANTEQAFATFTLTQNSGFEVLGNNYLSIYIGSVAVANLLPGGSGIDETEWQVIGPFYRYDSWVDQGFPKHKEIVSIYVLNLTAGNQTVIFNNVWHYFSPREGA